MAKTVTLTEGTPWKQILLFSIPIFWGNVFQILYSLVDTKIVGSILGSLALASVGSVSSLHTLLVSFLNGLTLGFSIITAMYAGGRKPEKVRQSFAAAIELGLLTTMLVVVILMIFLRPILHLLNVPDAEFSMAYAYISILIVGLLVTVLYNTCANILRAIGDSLTPLVFLIIASVTNVALDYLFILGFQWGVKGAALATVLAQLLSVILCFIRIRRRFPVLHAEKADFKLPKSTVIELYKSGLSMGLMSCLVGFGTIFLQSAINTLGTTVIVAHTAARKVFEVLTLPNSVLGAAMSTYCGQNYGARKYARIRRGLKSALLMAVCWCAVVFVLVHTLSEPAIRFIASTSDSEILYWGSTYLRIDMSFLTVCAFIVILRNSMQGFGDRLTPVLSSGIELAGKTVFAFLLVPVFGYRGVIWAEPVVWILMVIPLIVRTRKILHE